MTLPFGLPSPKILLDTNALRYCFGCQMFSDAEMHELRVRMEEHAAAETLRFVLTLPVAWELTKFHFEDGPAMYRDLVRFHCSIGQQWALKHEHERTRMELLARRRLSDDEAFEACDITTSLAIAADQAMIARTREMQLQLKIDERNEECAKRTAVVEALGEDWKSNLTNGFATDWNRTVGRYVNVEMHRRARRYGLRIAGWRWPLPRNVPTLWFGEAFYVAKARRVFVESKKELTSKKSLKDMPDVLDATHFRDAAYADVLVTHDEAFREVAIAARTPLRVMSFEQFARAVLA